MICKETQIMEKRVNNKIKKNFDDFKKSLLQVMIQEGFEASRIETFINGYEFPELEKLDFAKRRRMKNVIPCDHRCCALKSDNTQCTRRRKDGSKFCGTHSKGTPHGVVEDIANVEKVEKVEIWHEDIQGIYYLIDKKGNIYDEEDVIENKVSPKIIGKYTECADGMKIVTFN